SGKFSSFVMASEHQSVCSAFLWYCLHKKHRSPVHTMFEKTQCIPLFKREERRHMTLIPLSPVQSIALILIRLDGGTQSRLALNEEYIHELLEAVSAGETLPPVIIYYDGTDYWLADGFHRYHACKRNERETIASEIRQGTRRDAVLYSVGANA